MIEQSQAIANGMGPGASGFTEDAIVIGAGPAGLAASHMLSRAGLLTRVLERTDRVGSSWYSYYRGLRLNSPRHLSSLPGLEIDRGCGRWPVRNDVIVYLERYAREKCPEIDFGVDVQRLERIDGGWLVATSQGTMTAPCVVLATGLNMRPVMPPWPGADEFRGELLHARDYRDANPYVGRDVMVVGCGMSGSDIALELLAIGAKRVRVSVRTPPLIYRPQVLGVPTSFVAYMLKMLPKFMHPLADPYTLALHHLMYGNLSQYGLRNPSGGLLKAMKTRSHGVLTDRGFVAAVKAGEIEIVPAVDGFDGDDVVLAGGARVQPEAVIAATGQRPHLDPLVGHLGVLGEDGRPVLHGARTSRRAPGLFFIGYRLPPGQLPDMARDSRAIARKALRIAGGPRLMKPSGTIEAAPVAAPVAVTDELPPDPVPTLPELAPTGEGAVAVAPPLQE